MIRRRPHRKHDARAAEGAPVQLEVRVPEPTGAEADRVGRVLADWIREQRARRGLPPWSERGPALTIAAVAAKLKVPASLLRAWVKAGMFGPPRSDGRLAVSMVDRLTPRTIFYRSLRAPNARPAVVYFIADGDCIKIGRSREDAGDRITALATGNPRELKLLGTLAGTVETERVLHWRFRGLRIRGEWFRAAPGLLLWIAMHRDRG